MPAQALAAVAALLACVPHGNRMNCNWTAAAPSCCGHAQHFPLSRALEGST